MCSITLFPTEFSGTDTTPTPLTHPGKRHCKKKRVLPVREIVQFRIFRANSHRFRGRRRYAVSEFAVMTGGKKNHKIEIFRKTPPTNTFFQSCSKCSKLIFSIACIYERRWNVRDVLMDERRARTNVRK